jgi:hypothetical protein
MPPIQRVVLRTERGVLRPAWRLAYALAARGYAMWLAGRRRDTTVYLRAGRGAVFGLSDLDPAVVVEDRRGHDAVLARRERLLRLLPGSLSGLFDVPYVVHERELAAAVPAPLHGLDRGAALYHGNGAGRHAVRLAENPGLYGLTAGWRRLSGPVRDLPADERDAQARRAAAWLGIQATWRWYLQSCRSEPGPRWDDLRVKAVAEPARAWLWLAWGERTDGRRGTLERALELMGEQSEALTAALELERSLGRGHADGDDFAAHFVDLTAHVASLTAAQVAGRGATEVALRWEGQDDLALERNASFRLAPLLGNGGTPPLLPLVDWRAMVGASQLVGEPVPAPDETIAPLALDPREPGRLAAAAGAGNDGPYPALRSGEVLVLAAERWPRTQLRGVACAVTDPVSFALLDGRGTASFPAVAGWSARDVARRAVAEHAAWLGGSATGDNDPAVAITAARAALFYDSLEAGEPELTLTAAATLRQIGDPAGAEDAYRRLRLEGRPVPASTAAALRAAAAQLPAFRRARPSGASASRSASAGTAGS